MKNPPHDDPMTMVLARFRDQEKTAFADAWVGLEPTFQTAKSVCKWKSMSSDHKGGDAYFKGPCMQKTQRKVARTIRKRYEAQLRKGRPHCMFARVGLAEDLDPWKVPRQNLSFHWAWAAWRALRAGEKAAIARDPVHKELRTWQARRSAYLARRQAWSPVAGSRPWQARS